jgi:hypothetical protein
MVHSLSFTTIYLEFDALPVGPTSKEPYRNTEQMLDDEHMELGSYVDTNG